MMRKHQQWRPQIVRGTIEVFETDFVEVTGE
jgi:hypothetical protein